ncbi:MAG: acyltransferase family protein [Ruminococcus sp.]
MTVKKKYYGIDWLRTIACIGIILMHIKANTNYSIDGFTYNKIIPSLVNFVFLFMIISAFSMCCGYFDKVMNGTINWVDFYKKRYLRILPFFMLLIIIDLVMQFSTSSLMEGFAEITLLHGFIPKTLSVIGVGWYLGIVFIFYLIFPFFCVLISKKSLAWISFAISMGLHYICANYFMLSEKNIIYSLCYFFAGGLIYLYRESLEKIKWYVYLPIILCSLLVFFLVNNSTLVILLVFCSLMSFAVSIQWNNKIVSFISGISMEIYLSHMLVFRVIEKLHLTTMFGNGWVQYIICVGSVILVTIIFSFVVQKVINIIIKKITNVKKRQDLQEKVR